MGNYGMNGYSLTIPFQGISVPEQISDIKTLTQEQDKVPEESVLKVLPCVFFMSTGLTFYFCIT